jgi:hypothetical protein
MKSDLSLKNTKTSLLPPFPPHRDSEGEEGDEEDPDSEDECDRKHKRVHDKTQGKDLDLQVTSGKKGSAKDLLGEICVLVENYSVDQEVMIDNEAPTRGLVVVPTSKLPTSEEGESSMGMSEMSSYRDDASSVGQQTRILGAERQSLNEMGFQHTENDFLVVARDKELKGTAGDGLNRAIPKEGDDISQEVPDECNVLPEGKVIRPRCLD